MVLSEKSYAKINLFLQVLNKRDDGFHNLNTLFTKINLYDIIKIEESDVFEIYSTNKLIPKDENNIIWKVKNIVEEEYNKEILVNVFIEKNIPVGGGLGGGSSNAATFLNLIDKYYCLKMNYEKKSEILAQVGSDTVFFLHDKPMIGTSRGEILSEAPKIPKLNLLIVNPNIFISTGQVFKDNNLRLTAKKEVIRMRLLSSVSELVDIMKNDLENPVFSRFPVIAEIKNLLEGMGAVKAMMTGSGSTLYGVFQDDNKLDFACKYFKDNFKDYFVLKTTTI